MTSVQDYNWLVTDVFPLPIEGVNKDKMEEGYYFLTTEDILAISDMNPWLFAVFSGFKSTIPLASILKNPLPYADGNSSLWKYPANIQHPMAEIEIIAWDGILFICRSRESTVIDEIMRKFPEAIEYKDIDDE